MANSSQAERLLALSREMLECANVGDWEQLGRLEKTRLPLFNDIFAQGVSDNIELARDVLALDNKTRSLAEAGMPVLQNQILLMRKSGKANMAYQAVHASTAVDK